MVEDSNLGKNDKNVKKESDLKKFLKKRSFIYLMCAVVFVVFFVPDIGKTFAQLSPVEKNKISHRAIALKKLRKILINVL